MNGEKLVNVKQLHAQIAAVSKALAELELSGDKALMQRLETRLAEVKAQLRGARPIGQQVDGLRGVMSRCQKRLAEAETAKVDAEATIIKETEDIASYQAQLAELEPLLASSAGFRGRWTGQWDAGVASKHSIINRQTRARERDAVAQSLLGLLVPAPPPIPPDALRSGTLDNNTDMCDMSNRGGKHEGSADWPQNTNKVRLTKKTVTEETPQLEDTKGRRRGVSSDS